MTSGKIDRILPLCLTAALLGHACDKADFGSGSSKVTNPKTVKSGCDNQDQAKGIVDVEVNGKPEDELQLTGEFCPRASAQVRLLFLVDFSLSMYNPTTARGNDPPVNGGCGRLEAAKALIRRHQEILKDQQSEIKIGAIKFSSNIVGTLPFVAPEAAAAQVTSDNYCQGTDGTNYKTVFDATAAMLKDEPGEKIVYFITDGMPTEGGGGARELAVRHRDAAVSAQQALRAAVPNLTFNTVYLGNILEIKDASLDPEAFLVQITGDRERVKLVEKAENLAQEAVTLDAPPVEVDTSTAEAVLLVGDATSGRSVDLTYFKARKDDDEVWDFKTVPFTPFPKGATASRLVVRAANATGEKYEIVYNLRPAASAP